MEGAGTPPRVSHVFGNCLSFIADIEQVAVFAMGFPAQANDRIEHQATLVPFAGSLFFKPGKPIPYVYSEIGRYLIAWQHGSTTYCYRHYAQTEVFVETRGHAHAQYPVKLHTMECLHGNRYRREKIRA